MGWHGDTLRNPFLQLPCWDATRLPHPNPDNPPTTLCTLPYSLCHFPSCLLCKQQGSLAPEPSSPLRSWHGASFHVKIKMTTYNWMDFQKRFILIRMTLPQQGRGRRVFSNISGPSALTHWRSSNKHSQRISWQGFSINCCLSPENFKEKQRI